MTSFCVWAPRAKRAEPDIRGKREPMTTGKDGLFAEVSSTGANTQDGIQLPADSVAIVRIPEVGR